MGSGIGAGSAAITGGDVGKGAWMGAAGGAIGGAIFGPAVSPTQALPNAVREAGTRSPMILENVMRQGLQYGVQEAPKQAIQKAPGFFSGGLSGTLSNIGTSLTSPLIGSQAWSSPLMLGTAGMGLMQAFGSQGQAYQDKIELSAEGEKAEEQYGKYVKKEHKRALAGDVTDKAFQDISKAKTQEGAREQMSQKMFRTLQAGIGNTPKTSRGSATMGGKAVTASIADAGDRMSGLFQPASILNAYRKEALVNSIKGLQNLYNQQQQTAAVQFNSNLAAWQANTAAAAGKGAALGGVAQLIGGSTHRQAYYKKLDKIYS